jgi:hypothetical protein
MRRKIRVMKAEAAKARGTTQRKTVTLIASVEVPKNAHVMIEQFQRMWKGENRGSTGQGFWVCGGRRQEWKFPHSSQNRA